MYDPGLPGMQIFFLGQSKGLKYVGACVIDLANDRTVIKQLAIT